MAKPADPKEATEAALCQVRKPRSSAIYLELAEKVSLQGHSDLAFLRSTRALWKWFALPAILPHKSSHSSEGHLRRQLGCTIPAHPPIDLQPPSTMHC